MPVEVWRHDILKVSASMVSTPDEPGTGEMREAMAWIEWNVEAKTRYSLDESWVSPSARTREAEG